MVESSIRSVYINKSIILSLNASLQFLRHCKEKFGWSDMSREVIMDIGCGGHLNCGKSILNEHPDVLAVIAIDKDEDAITISRCTTRIDCEVADIEKRDTLERYLGNMTKVISLHAFHELGDIKTAFQNVYHLLRPGGEAAVRFVARSSTHDWFVEILKNPKWRYFFQEYFFIDSFSNGIPKYNYAEMAREMGFKVVECLEKDYNKVYESDAACKELLNSYCNSVFKIPPELVEEFKESIHHAFIKKNVRDSQGRLIYKKTELTLLLIKPAEGSS